MGGVAAPAGSVLPKLKRSVGGTSSWMRWESISGVVGDGDGIGVMCLGIVYGNVDQFKKEMV